MGPAFHLSKSIAKIQLFFHSARKNYPFVENYPALYAVTHATAYGCSVFCAHRASNAPRMPIPSPGSPGTQVTTSAECHISPLFFTLLSSGRTYSAQRTHIDPLLPHQCKAGYNKQSNTFQETSIIVTKEHCLNNHPLAV